ncbi:MAG: sulfotransferase family protein [Lentisphaerae bacterium]|nr:sulfotransferase family protein [Lentisphaerota bacterium]
MITIVSGLPRSGTSMMMQMLCAGGIPPLTDHVRSADDDNPRGYYELEVAKKIRDDVSWLPEAEGKVFKIVSMLLFHLPPGYRYQVVFMLRDLDEMLASQAAMLARKGESSKAPDDVLKTHFKKHLDAVRAWLTGQPHIDVLYCRHREVVADPAAAAARLDAFLDVPLDTAAMARAVDPALYRQRR